MVESMKKILDELIKEDIIFSINHTAKQTTLISDVEMKWHIFNIEETVFFMTAFQAIPVTSEEIIAFIKTI